MVMKRGHVIKSYDPETTVRAGERETRVKEFSFENANIPGKEVRV